MLFKDFFFSLPQSEREKLAGRCRVSVGHLRNVAYGLRSANPEICVEVEKSSRQQVKREDMRPDDFKAIWPELARPRRPKRQEVAVVHG